jgi:histone deacetylase 1/2
MIKQTTVRLVLSVAVSRGWHIRQGDVKYVFAGTVYMIRPPGFEDPHHNNVVSKLEKAIYELKLKHWFTRPSSTSWGFSLPLPSLFILQAIGITTVVLVYVDDLILTSSVTSAMDDLLCQLWCAPVIKDLGFTLSLHKNICDLLHRTSIIVCKIVSIPMSNT